MGFVAVGTDPRANAGAAIWRLRERVVALAAGGQHNLLLTEDGTVLASGSNERGQISVPLGLSGVVAIAAGYAHSVALRSDGSVVAWGNNSRRATEVPPGMADVIAISAGGGHSAAVRNDGTVVIWGQLGFGTLGPPPGLANVRAMASGSECCFAILADDSVSAWGQTQFGSPEIPSDLRVRSIAGGGGPFPGWVAARSDGKVAVGGFLVGREFEDAPSDVIQVAAGDCHALALGKDGTVGGWGTSPVRHTIPSGLSGVISIAAGSDHSLALLTDGSVVAWGMNGYQQLQGPRGSTIEAVGWEGDGYHLPTLSRTHSQQSNGGADPYADEYGIWTGEPASKPVADVSVGKIGGSVTITGRSLAEELARAENWSRYTLGDLREALRTLVLLTLPDSTETARLAHWSGRCDNEIDFLLYSFALRESISHAEYSRGHPDVSGDPAKSVSQLVNDWSSRRLQPDSRETLLATYLNKYLFNYVIGVELPRLIDSASYGGKEVSQALMQLLTQVDRAKLPSPEWLRKFSRRYRADRNPNDLLERIFEPVFRLMMRPDTESKYFRVHQAVLALLSVSASDFSYELLSDPADLVIGRPRPVKRYVIAFEGNWTGGYWNVPPDARHADIVFSASHLPEVTSGSVSAGETGKTSGSGGCYIATAVYGSYDCPEVWVLRRWRDRRLARTAVGRMFIRVYYTVSPGLARQLGSVRWIAGSTRSLLDRLVAHLRQSGLSDEPYRDRKLVEERGSRSHPSPGQD